MDVKKCKDLSVTVLYKLEEADTLTKSEMAVTDRDCPAVSGLRDVRKVVRRQDEPLGGPTKIPAGPDSRQEIPAPIVDLVTGQCKPVSRKVSRTVSASPLMIDMTVVCTPVPDPVQPGVVAHELPPTKTVKTSMTDTPFITTPTIVGGERTPQVKKLSTFDLSDSSELLPSFGLSSSSSSSSSPTLPWGTAEDSSPSFSPNRVREGQSQNTPSEGSV